LNALKQSGLGSLPEEHCAPAIQSLHLSSAGHEASVPLPGGAVLSRTALDEALTDAAADAGVTFVSSVHVALGEMFPDKRSIILRREGEEATVSAKVVIAADGLGGRLLRDAKSFDTHVARDSRVGAGTQVADAPSFYERGTIYMACGSGGYVGLARLGNGDLNVAASLDVEYTKRSGGPASASGAILASSGFPSVPFLEGSQWKGTPALTRVRMNVSAHRLLVLGDAAGYVEPFTGEGMATAMGSALAVAPIVMMGLEEWGPDIESEWANGHRRLTRRSRAVCRLLSKGLRHPKLVAYSIAALSRAPGLARPVVHHLNRPYSTVKVSSS
jgi:flavin-dependent dehydrogenase